MYVFHEFFGFLWRHVEVLNACIDVRRASYAGRDGDEEIEFSSFCSKSLDEWVIFVNFFLSCGSGESIVTSCVYSVWWEEFSGGGSH